MMAKKLVKVPKRMKLSFRDPYHGVWYTSYVWNDGVFHFRFKHRIGKRVNHESTLNVKGPLEYKDYKSVLKPIQSILTKPYRDRLVAAAIAKLTRSKSKRGKTRRKG